ncbi:MAG TPA: hypothetical protein VH500_20290 [Nitrososphaeraceae archaeon]|jgi:hypothetical protein
MIVATYTVFTTTKNPAIAATIPGLIGFAACPAMCVSVGGVFWFINHIANKNKNDNYNRNIISGKITAEKISSESRQNNSNFTSCCSENNTIEKNIMKQNEEMITTNTNGQDNTRDTIRPNQQKEWQGKHIMNYNN